MLRWLYGPVRPVVRPVMRRLRMFFVGRLHDEVAELHQEVRELRATVLLQVRTDDERLRDLLADALATLSLASTPPPDEILPGTEPREG